MQKAFTIHGEQVIISVLGAPLEPLFEHFYTNYFDGKPLPWEEIATAAREYFNQYPTTAGAHDAYFNNFISLWRKMLQIGAFVDAERVWEQALAPALRWEEEAAGRRLHKGTPYYFWAMTVIIRRDMDRGYLIIHKAVEEDIQTSGQQTPDTPGYALVSLSSRTLVDPDKYFVILADALRNGVSSLPSNSKQQPRMRFPAFAIRDMVNSQHEFSRAHTPHSPPARRRRRFAQTHVLRSALVAIWHPCHSSGRQLEGWRGQKEAENEQFRAVFRRDIRHTIDGSIAADPASTGMRAAMSRHLQSKPTLLRHHNWDALQIFGLRRHSARSITARRGLP